MPDAVTDGRCGLWRLDPDNGEEWLSFVKQCLGFQGTWPQLIAQYRPLAAVLDYARIQQRATSIVAERQYVDLDYRSEFSAHYATTFERYDTFCTRLHFFGGSPIPDLAALSLDGGGIPGSSYLGYTIVRPLRGLRLSRTVLRPAFGDSGRAKVTCVARSSVHLYGREFVAEGGYFVQQDGVVICCAQASIWMAAAYLHCRHDLPRLLPAGVTEAATRHLSEHGRPIPTSGLDARQMANALVNCGYFPDSTFGGTSWASRLRSTDRKSSPSPIVTWPPEYRS